MTVQPLAVRAPSAIMAHDAVAAGPATAGAPTVSLMRRGAAEHQKEESYKLFSKAPVLCV